MKKVLYYSVILCWWTFIKSTYQQDSSDDGNDDDDSCSYISGQNCDNDGICKYCAMCLQSSCILSKSIPSNRTTTGTPVCNATQFGTTNVYDWYGYCLSSGNDNSGDYCATSTECYQYRRSNASTSYIWQSLTCDPNSCLLVTDNGQPAPTPGALPPTTDSPSASNNHHSPTSSHHITPQPHNEVEEHNPTAIALSVTCTLIFVAALAWLLRLWKKSRYWPPPFMKYFSPSTMLSQSSPSSTPSSAPPSFRSAPPEMTSITPSPSGNNQPISSSTTSSRSSSTNRGEPLPSYFSPDPSPPKYEHAIVTQIRGLLEDSNYQYETGSSSSSMDLDHHNNALPPPMWVPVYFAPNHSSFSLGRLRRHPHHQPMVQQAASSSSNVFHDDHASPNNEQDLGSSSVGVSANAHRQHR